METIVLAASAAEAIESAVSLLRQGKLVALPTETVYGLAGDALNPMAVTEIFAAKKRPHFDPLIVHLGAESWLREYADPSPATMRLLDRLAEGFWPGPLTILLPKKKIVPDLVTAGLADVALRIPSHPTFQKIIQTFGRPLAAPSANRFGRVSPTSVQHVRSELSGRIPLIIDAGPTTLGLESTIVRLAPGKIELLRPGPITREQLQRFGPVQDFSAGSTVIAPGQVASHYAPEHALRILEPGDKPLAGKRLGLICWGPADAKPGFVLVKSLSEKRDPAEAATRLFSLLREMDQAELDLIYAEPVPERGIGVAIMNRLRRAAAQA
jgi:L-threonylcarbamoyladenylate synthase